MSKIAALVLCPLILVACAQQSAPPLSVTGTWQGVTDYGSGVRLVLTQNGASVGGVFYTSSQLTPTVFRRWGPLTGVLDGTQLSLNATGDPGEFAGALTSFTGEVQGDQYAGRLTTISGGNTDTTGFSTVRSADAALLGNQPMSLLAKEMPISR